MRKNGRQVFLFLLLFGISFLAAQIHNPGYTGITANEDSLFWQPNYLILGAPDSSSISIEIQAPALQKTKALYYDSREVMPKNMLFLDTRTSSYYMPRQVSDKLTRIMNRPSSNEVAPVFAAAVLAASIASQYVHIGYELHTDASDYVVDEKYYPILAALWEKSPQTAYQLFKIEAIEKERTVVILQNELSELTDLNLIKVRIQEKAPNLFFPAQQMEEVEQLLSEAIHKETLLADQKQKLRALLRIIAANSGEGRN